jgi:hypothetical protein
MNQMPVAIRPALRRLARRLAVGLFLDMWPLWAVASLLLAGLVALACRMFFPGAASGLYWLWTAPLLTAIPVLIVCFLRPYRPDEVVALADWLSGGQGMLLTLLEQDDAMWAESNRFDAMTRFALPRVRPWRQLAMLPVAAAFLAAALWLPQRVPARAGNAVLADDIAADLTATLVELKQQELITPDEEQRLEEEVERIRLGAQERVDSSSWEAADALREKVAARLSEKQDALKWAEESLARYAAAQAGGNVPSTADVQSAELSEALEKLAQSGLLAGAPSDLQRLLKGGKLPADAASLRELQASLSEYLASTRGRFGDLARLGKEFGRFDPSEFPLDSDQAAADGAGNPGRGGITRGRADAPLTWGKESLPFDRFTAKPLPPGSVRSPDDWAPVVVFSGAPQESPTPGTPSVARQYADGAGQTAWRRSLTPRHRSAVKKYFEK